MLSGLLVRESNPIATKKFENLGKIIAFIFFIS